MSDVPDQVEVHHPSIAERSDGSVGVYCQPCSEKAAEYTYCATIAKDFPERLVSLAWVREQLNDETLRESLTRVRGIDASLAVIRAHFGGEA